MKKTISGLWLFLVLAMAAGASAEKLDGLEESVPAMDIAVEADIQDIAPEDITPAIAAPLPGQDQWPAVWREIVRVVIEKGKRDYIPRAGIGDSFEDEIKTPFVPIRTMSRNTILTPYRRITVIGKESGGEFIPRAYAGIVLRYRSKAVACDFVTDLEGVLKYVIPYWNCHSRGKGDVVNGGSEHFLEEFKFWKKHLVKQGRDGAAMGSLAKGPPSGTGTAMRDAASRPSLAALGQMQSGANPQDVSAQFQRAADGSGRPSAATLEALQAVDQDGSVVRGGDDPDALTPEEEARAIEVFTELKREARKETPPPPKSPGHAKARRIGDVAVGTLGGLTFLTALAPFILVFSDLGPIVGATAAVIGMGLSAFMGRMIAQSKLGTRIVDWLYR